MSSCSAWRWVTSAIGPPWATAALSAVTLFSRPTWSGHDHLREDDRLAQGDERQLTRGWCLGGCCSGGSGLGRRLALRISWLDASAIAGSWRAFAACRWSGRSRQRDLGHCGRGRRGAGVRRSARGRRSRCGRLIPFVEEGFEDPRPEALLELEQEPDPGEVHAPVPGEVADPQDPPDVVFAVQADVGRGASGADQALVLVDPQRARMDADDAGRHADHVDGTRMRRDPARPSRLGGQIALPTVGEHVRSLEPDNAVVKSLHVRTHPKRCSRATRSTARRGQPGVVSRCRAFR